MPRVERLEQATPGCGTGGLDGAPQQQRPGGVDPGQPAAVDDHRTLRERIPRERVERRLQVREPRQPPFAMQREHPPVAVAIEIEGAGCVGHGGARRSGRRQVDIASPSPAGSAPPSRRPSTIRIACTSGNM